MAERYWVETLGCPKNQVDSDKLAGTLEADGYVRARAPEEADLVVVNTCAFIEAAREESVATILALAEVRRPGARLVVTGCLAERYGDELAACLPEAERVAGFGVPVSLRRPTRSRFDLLELPRPPARAPWAYVKVAEGCDRACGYCAIPTFRGPQRSRPIDAVLAEVAALQAKEVVLVAQDTARYGLDQGRGARRLPELIGKVATMVERVRVLYLHPADVTDELIDAVCATGVPYFDLSLQHASRPLLRRMRRWGDGPTFLRLIETIRRREPEAVFRSNFIVGYPGETESDHDALLAFLEEARLDWCGFFAYSPEEGTYASTLSGTVPASLVAERLRELSEVADRIMAERRAALVGREVEVLVDVPGVGRTYREAPEIDGVVRVPHHLPVGSFATVTVTAAAGFDLEAA